jgi:CheY-like chemotaxis protein
MERALVEAGYEVTTAADGVDALERLRERHHDLVLADIRMPVMDGIALALAVARDHPLLPVILMTGYADQRQRARGIESLVRDVIAKPFSAAELCAAVEGALAAQKSLSSRSM